MAALVSDQRCGPPQVFLEVCGYRNKRQKQATVQERDRKTERKRQGERQRMRVSYVSVDESPLGHTSTFSPFQPFISSV